MIESFHESENRDKYDRSDLYLTVASNYETNKMLKKIPDLMKENRLLKEKVQKLEE